MKINKTIGTAIMVSAIIAALAGCQKEPGPGEKAGKAVDKAIDKTGQQMEKAGDKIQDAAKGDKK
jgi:hypothetical protein